ncbi:MAG: glycosyltransferase family 4 protein [Candidatus Omnitrophota bacterium]
MELNNVSGMEKYMDVKQIRILQISAVDVTVKYLLRPLIDKLGEEGYNVCAVCSRGRYISELREKGYSVDVINIDRKISFISNLKSLFFLYNYIRKNRFHVVHVHSPIASVLGRIAAKIARVPIIIYTAHGFYFHDNMEKWKRRIIIWVEKILGHLCTDMLFLQSREDEETVKHERIIEAHKVLWISNGVDIETFTVSSANDDLKRSFGINKDDLVVGFVGRIVKEKGIEELVSAVYEVKKDIPNVKLLIAGDTLCSDRDTKTKKSIEKFIQLKGLENSIIFAGLKDNMPEIYGVMDVFVLPSYREGMPRSIIEAMASGKPVVATDIRGAREEVVKGITGELVPVKDVSALAAAVKLILRNNDLAVKMGHAARERAVNMFDENMVLKKESETYKKLINEKI